MGRNNYGGTVGTVTILWAGQLKYHGSIPGMNMIFWSSPNCMD